MTRSAEAQQDEDRDWQVRRSHTDDSCTQETWSLIERIKEAVNTCQGRGADTDAAAVLARHDLPIGEWRRALRAIGAGATATWRTAAVDADRLWNVLVNPLAEPRDRAAAAIALSASEEQGSRERVRVAARAIVQPKLRVAVLAASNDDETALDEALASLADQRQQV